MSFDLHCGLISCSRAGYDVRVWDPKTMDLLLVLDQLNDGPDLRACHPNLVQNQRYLNTVSQMVHVLDALEVAHGEIDIDLSEPSSEIKQTLRKPVLNKSRLRIKQEQSLSPKTNLMAQVSKQDQRTMQNLDRLISDQDRAIEQATELNKWNGGETR